LKILIIDDSIVMRKIVEAAVRSTGLPISEIAQAANGREGLAALEMAAAAQPIDLVLCDIHMPVMDGLAFLHELRRRRLGLDVTVVMITADPSDPHLFNALSSGAAGYISKPFTVEQIGSRLASLTGICGHFARPAAIPAHTSGAIGGAP
jgi:two-component system chemotaxis response regulator CheY